MLLRSATGLYFFGVPATCDEGVTVTGENLTVSATLAAPGEPDPVQDVAPKISARLLRAYAADDHGMKGHAA